MKCLKNISTLEIKRVSEERAIELVAGGAWLFACKKEWKAQRPAVIKVETVVEVVDASVRPKKVPGKKSAYREELRRKRNSK